MGKLRFYFALWMAKLSIPALAITHHNGTDFPGSLALKICPDFLKYVGKPETIVAITGTNGKTTVSNMLSGLLESEGRHVVTNRTGSNIVSGIATALLRGCNLAGKVTKYDIAVLEVDERLVAADLSVCPARLRRDHEPSPRLDDAPMRTRTSSRASSRRPCRKRRRSF